MKILKFSTFFLLMFSLSVLGEVKLGYIDSNRIMKGYKGINEIEKKYNDKLNEWQKRAESLKKEIQDLQKQVQTQGLLLSQEAKVRKMQEIQTKQQEYENFLQSIWGQNGEAKKLNDQLMKPLLAKVDSILKKIGAEDGYTMILDISSGVVVYADEGLDITDEVIDELNSEFAPVKEAKIYFYVAKFKEKTGEASSLNLGEKLKNLVTANLKGRGPFDVVEHFKIANAENSEGILREEDMNESEALSVIKKADSRLIVIGDVTKNGEDIVVSYKVIDSEKNKTVISSSSSVKGENKLDIIVNDIITKVLKEYNVK